MVELIEVNSGPRIEDIRSLFVEYAQSLDFSLCFQGFDKEMEGLPRPYAPPEGRLILCTVDGNAAGCIGLKSLGAGVCEMKRLFVKRDFRGRGIGLKLATHVIEEARRIGYSSMRLDTLPGRMDAAIGMYRRFGFVEIPPYYENPVPNALYMELTL